jgi:hypothetical protein
VEEEKMTASNPVLNRRLYRIGRTAMSLSVVAAGDSFLMVTGDLFAGG